MIFKIAFYISCFILAVLWFSSFLTIAGFRKKHGVRMDPVPFSRKKISDKPKEYRTVWIIRWIFFILIPVILTFYFLANWQGEESSSEQGESVEVTSGN